MKNSRAEVYEQKSADIQKQLKELMAKLENHKAKFDANQQDWGYIGDIQHIYEKLNDINLFLNY